MPEPNDQTTAFITRWQGVTASELSTSQSFVIELCELLGVARPHATAEQDPRNVVPRLCCSLATLVNRLACSRRNRTLSDP